MLYMFFFILLLSNLLRLVLTEEFLDDGLKENSKPRKEKLQTGYASENSTMIVKRKVRPRVKTCYHNFFLHNIIVEPSYMINELMKHISDFFWCISFYSSYPSKSRTTNKHYARTESNLINTLFHLKLFSSCPV